MQQQREISRRFYSTFVGQTLEAMVDGPDSRKPGYLATRARFQAPEVDGQVLVRLSPELRAKENLPAFLSVRIERSLDYDLIGQVTDD